MARLFFLKREVFKSKSNKSVVTSSLGGGCWGIVSRYLLRAVAGVSPGPGGAVFAPWLLYAPWQGTSKLILPGISSVLQSTLTLDPPPVTDPTGGGGTGDTWPITEDLGDGGIWVHPSGIPSGLFLSPKIERDD